MSRITGIRDFADFFYEHGIEYCKKLTFYKGYYDYVYNNPIDTSSFNTEKDWMPFFHYEIKVKFIYPKLGTGTVVLQDRDYLSEQDDIAAYQGKSRRVEKMRKNFISILVGNGYTLETAERLAEYKFELNKGEKTNEF